MNDVEDKDAGLVAVVGMAGRFPGAPDLVHFWRNVRDGVESVRWFTEEELLALGEAPHRLRDPHYVRACPVLEDIDKFDAGFFGFSPREAMVTDPQHRIFLETAWAAMEDAGLVPERAAGPVGVFATSGQSTYLMHHLVTNADLMETVGEWLLRHMGNDMNFLATRASYEFDLRGPSMNVQTACSSSLVAIHQAIQSLLSGECDAALAGGSTISFPLLGYLYKEGEILSSDGRCRPFDARSSGTLFGSGVGVVVLKRLADARAHGNTILAVVRGSAINNDGAQKMGYLAPSVDGQARVIAEALAVSGTSPDTISYVEAHGTGTLVGDPIEVAALVQAYRASTARVGFCGLGSLKSNIGHLGEAAGVAGFIKTVLALKHREMPPSLHYELPNPSIDLGSSPFFVNARLRPWDTARPLRAGITALGAGGTNAHLILEEAPPLAETSPSDRAQLLTLSARTTASLDAATKRLAAHLRVNRDTNLADVAYTLQVGRRAFAHRRTLVAHDVAEAIDLLDGNDPKRVLTQAVPPGGVKRELVFLFAGGGAQYAAMGQELYETEPVYRAAIDECLEYARAAAVSSELGALMFPPAGQAASASKRLEAPSLALPALFATAIAMARLLASFGLEPASMIGHSMGEYVAACVAGVLSVRDGMRLVAARGRLFETLPRGGMLVVPLSASEARAALPDFDEVLSIAAINAPELCVVSGPVAHVERIAVALTARGIETSRVHIDVAAHSSMLDPILKPFEELCRTIRFSPPQTPYVSNLTGTWIRAEDVMDPRYWVRHLRDTVRFSDGLAAVFASPDRVVVEVGPGRTLASLARQQPIKPAAAIATMEHAKEASSSVAFLASTLGQIWMAGVEPDWPRCWERENRRLISLPTYAFERRRHWVDRPELGARSQPTKARTLAKVPEIADWFWVPTWKRSIAPEKAPSSKRRLLFADDRGLGERLRARWPGAIVVTRGSSFGQSGPDAFVVDPAQRAHFDLLIAALRNAGRLPEQVVHLDALSRFDGDDAVLDACFLGLFHLGQVLALEENAIEIVVVSPGIVDPRTAVVQGPLRVIPAEIPFLACRQVEVAWPSSAPERVEDQIVCEAEGASTDRAVAYRGPARFVETFEAVPVKPLTGLAIRHGGVYVITGGFGGVGLALAEHLATKYSAKLVLVGRTADGIPAREAARSLEARGAEVICAAADVTDEARMREVLVDVRGRFGTVHGVIHAAGVLDDGLIQMKTGESCMRVLAPKVRGALVLDRLCRGDAAPVDFLAFFSSVSAVLGLQGQVDYAAANAFLDALATERSARERGLTVSIGWSAWRDVGMAATLSARGRPARAPIRKARHAWLGDVLVDSADRIVYGSDLGRDDVWFLSEHVVRGGDSLIPGTGYLELAREAVTESRSAPKPIELSNVLFVAPFVVRAGESRPLRVAIDTDGEVTIGVGSAANSAIDVCMTAQARAVDTPTPSRLDLEAIAARCPRRRDLAGGKHPQTFMAFGPRWDNVHSLAIGDGEALVRLELADEFASDLEDGKQTLHPAMVDFATGGAQELIPGFDPARDFYVPFSYERVLVHRPLARRAFSHVRFQRQSTSDMPTFDATLFGEDGEVFVEITGFMMKRVPPGTTLTNLAPVARKEASPGPVAEATSMREAAFREGMLPTEGIEAFERIVAAGLGPQVIASSLNLHDWISALAARPAPTEGESTPDGASIGIGDRPALSTAFEAPRSDIERTIASVWGTLLGVGEVGVHDNFFELGGHSLLLTQIVTRVRKALRLDLPIRALLGALTVAEMASAAGASSTNVAREPPPIKKLSRDAFRVKRSSLDAALAAGGTDPGSHQGTKKERP